MRKLSGVLRTPRCARRKKIKNRQQTAKADLSLVRRLFRRTGLGDHPHQLIGKRPARQGLGAVRISFLRQLRLQGRDILNLAAFGDLKGAFHNAGTVFHSYRGIAHSRILADGTLD